jgi:aspartate aminotransferase-like enzyme
LYALDAQLESIVTESIERRWARHEAMRADAEQWVAGCAERLGIELAMFAPEGARSPTVSTITLPEGVTASAMVKAVAARGYTIGGGYGKVGERAFRIGHMGDHTVETLGRCLEVCGDALSELARTTSRPRAIGRQP